MGKVKIKKRIRHPCLFEGAQRASRNFLIFLPLKSLENLGQLMGKAKSSIESTCFWASENRSINGDFEKYFIPWVRERAQRASRNILIFLQLKPLENLVQLMGKAKISLESTWFLEIASEQNFLIFSHVTSIK